MFDMDVFWRSFLRNMAMVLVLLFGGIACLLLLATGIGVIGMLAGELALLHVVALFGMTVAFAAVTGLCVAIAEGMGVEVFGEEQKEKAHDKKQADEWD